MSTNQEPAEQSSSLRDRIIEGVERMVLWGETKEDVMHRLEVNGITGEDADSIYNGAFRERVATIHAHYRHIARIGLACLAGAAVIAAICIFVFEGINRALFLIIAALLAFGFWKTTNGILGMVTAKTKEGSVADLDD